MVDLSVADLMSQDVVTLERNDKLALVEERMQEKHIRHVVVVDDDGDLAGVISQRDVFLGGLLRGLGFGTRVKEQVLDSLLVKDAMKSNPVTTTPTTPLSEAATLMFDQKLGCLPVVEGERIVGVITEADFVALAAGRKHH